MTMHSYYQGVGKVSLPFKGRQIYMREFDLAEPMLPDGIRDYEDIAIGLCSAVGAYEGTAYITIDERHLAVGETQRKPGAHVDGRYIPKAGHWGHDGPGGSWNHSCNVIPGRMAVIVASSVPLCRVWEGDFMGIPRLSGDCSHLLDFADKQDDFDLLPAEEAFLFSPDCIHESIPATVECDRSFMRIALPTSFHYTGERG